MKNEMKTRGRFTVGHRPKNAFPVGNTLSKKHPVGYERVDVYGFVVVKVAAPNTWRMKHHVIWEEKNGALAKGDVVIFVDGDKRNFNPDNLVKLTCAQFAYLRCHKLIPKNAELIQLAVSVAKVAQRAAAFTK